MSDRIFRMGDDGLTALSAEPFEKEEELERLIAKHPELLSFDDRRWILVRRQQGISEARDAADRWAVDLLLIDQDAVPTLVEVKRGTNPEVRRSVVGQILDYAAHARQSWDAADLRRTFEEREHSADELRGLLGTQDEPDADAFWDDVRRNLRASRLRLLIVADAIPAPLARVASLLNEQMSDMDVLAIEISRYVGDGRETLVPRVVGRSEKRRGPGAGATVTLDQIIDGFPEGSVRDAARQLIERARDAGATFEPGSLGTSIRLPSGGCSLWDGPITIGWVYPEERGNRIGYRGTRHFTFGVENRIVDAEPHGKLRDVLLSYLGQFENDEHAHDLGSPTLRAWYVQPDDAAANVDVLAGRLERVLADLKAL